MAARCPICDLPELDADRVILIGLVRVLQRFIGQQKRLEIRLRGYDAPQIDAIRVEQIPAERPGVKC